MFDIPNVFVGAALLVHVRFVDPHQSVQTLCHLTEYLEEGGEVAMCQQVWRIEKRDGDWVWMGGLEGWSCNNK